MKKLLSLLSVLTISGTAVPTTIAASPYQKEENNLEKSKINYSKTNNLENLSRSKRQQNDYSFINNDGMFYNYPTSSDFLEYYNEKSAVNINNKIYFTDRGNGGEIVLKEEDSSSGKLLIISNNINNDINGTINRFSMSSLKNELYFNSEKGIYKYDKEQKQIVLVYNYEITSNISILNEEFYFVSKNNICKYNIFESKLEIIKNIENNTINKIITNNNNIIFQSENGNTYGYLSFNFQNTNCFKLLQEWVSNFRTWKNEVNRQLKKDFSSFSLEQKRSWKGDKKNELQDKIHSLKQDLLIIKNSQAIVELENKFQNLQNSLIFLNNKIDDLNNKIDKINSSTSSDSLLTWCTNIGAGVAAGSAPIPVVGTLIAAISGLISAGCAIANSDMTITNIEFN